ncbi:nuclear transport factor 2 family protein [Amantichitinum ursilacus]|uniref:DUF4440 domain-containing protein n=1 Tax=Amantichitinum ursilacus TaxID=857265 RepID=A0A0N0GN72_9NEIS|nr:nuclear transport factor 2 family protein [Amantichitinum ursilacus]KPC52522.1 hypothetical protein WG78_11775 [Amantichitinum ursilacus]
MTKIFFKGGALGRAAALIMLALALSPASSYASPADDVSNAATDLYARMSAHDLAGVQRYVPATGFTEIEAGASAARRLDMQAFAALFQAPLDINLRATSLDVQVLGDTAIVIGQRVGSVTPKGKTAVASTVLFSSVWSLDAGHWQLRHMHLSAPAESPAQ